MNVKERVEVVLAMEKLARMVNDEDVFAHWLTMGVPDGSVAETAYDIGDLLDDQTFMELMSAFVETMHMAYEDGGLLYNEPGKIIVSADWECGGHIYDRKPLFED